MIPISLSLFRVGADKCIVTNLTLINFDRSFTYSFYKSYAFRFEPVMSIQRIVRGKPTSTLCDCFQEILAEKPIITQIEASTDTTEITLYQWFYNDQPIAGSHYRTINVSQEGMYKVAVKMSTFSNDIFISEPYNLGLPQGDSTAGLTTNYDVVYNVNNIPGSHNILIYPNPASSAIKIENALNSDIVIFNEMGKVVMTQKKIDNNQTINIPDFTNGVYFVRLTKDISSITQKLVIQKK